VIDIVAFILGLLLVFLWGVIGIVGVLSGCLMNEHIIEAMMLGGYQPMKHVIWGPFSIIPFIYLRYWKLR